MTSLNSAKGNSIVVRAVYPIQFSRKATLLGKQQPRFGAEDAWDPQRDHVGIFAKSCRAILEEPRTKTLFERGVYPTSLKWYEKVGLWFRAGRHFENASRCTRMGFLWTDKNGYRIVKKALKCFEKSRQAYAKRLGPHDINVGLCYLHSAWLYLYLGQAEKSKAHGAQAFEILSQKLPSEHPLVELAKLIPDLRHQKIF